MLKRFISLFTGDSTSSGKVVIPHSKHSIANNDVSRNAIKVIERLQQADFEAYLVGGGVRDLLLDGHPKDFDVATNATPEQVRKLFRNSRIIGRRFRIVHVRYGREVIEVTTFRSHHQEGSGKSQESHQSDEGMLLRDNVYGDLQSDAERRDFTINALYYDPVSRDILDYTRGVNDIDARMLRIIGDPATRFKEDPVRMLRAVRFAAKLGFEIEPKTAAPIADLASMLQNIPAARLWDESMKLFMSGYSTAIFHQMVERDLFKYLFPGSASHIANPQTMAFFENAMLNTDKRIRADKRVTPAFIFAVLLWPAVVTRQDELMAEGSSTALQAAHQAQQQVLQAQLNVISIPKRFTSVMREIWDLQAALPRRNGRRAYRTLEQQRFRAAYDFLLLREQSGEDHQGLGAWWTEFQFADEEKREQLIAALPRSGNNSNRRRRKPRRSPGQQNPGQQEG
ncbi:polynucleotide adenylyltransferase PcnB [Halioxenophilus aromaticivorans]|uniref:Poly(A) polymerase I n=1 Tax=Halioxenophilus aromaticivorans TaxID=1306992 RepID=A0AAV3U8R8_9ALTE